MTRLFAALAPFVLTACLDAEPDLGLAGGELRFSPAATTFEAGEPAPLGGAPDPELEISQYDGLAICFRQLEGYVAGCGQAYRNDVAAYNACIATASEHYDECLTWVRTLPTAS